MDMSTVPFDPTDVRAMNNPPFPTVGPFKVNTWQFIGQTIYVDPRRVKLMRDQPRTDADKADIHEMAESIRSVGQQESASAFPIHDPDFDVELIGGHRRTLSCWEAGCMLQVHIRPVPADRRQHYIAAVAGNCNRKDLSLRDTVCAIAELLSYECSYEYIGTIFGKTVGWVKQYALLTTLHPTIFPLLEGREEPQQADNGRKLRRVTMLTVSCAAEVAKLPQEEQPAAAEAILEEGMRIQSVKHFISQRLKRHGILRVNQHSPRERMRIFEEELRRFERFLQDYSGLATRELMAMSGERNEYQRGNIERRLLYVSQELGRIARLIGPIQAALSDCHPAIRDWVGQQTRAWQSSQMPLDRWINEQEVFSEETQVRPC